MTRSELMSRIRSRGNKSTELALARLLRRGGVTGWRRQRRVGGISVDFAFPKARIAVFVDGCFWHACMAHCRASDLSEYWQFKVLGNRARDIAQNARLGALGWKVVRVWEHDLKGGHDDVVLSVVRGAVSQRGA